MGLDLGFEHSKGPKMHFFGFWYIKTACYTKKKKKKKKVKIISSVDNVSLPIMTANFDDGGVFFRFCLYKR